MRNVWLITSSSGRYCFIATSLKLRTIMGESHDELTAFFSFCPPSTPSQETKGVSVELSEYKGGALKVNVPRLVVTDEQVKCDPRLA